MLFYNTALSLWYCIDIVGLFTPTAPVSPPVHTPFFRTIWVVVVFAARSLWSQSRYIPGGKKKRKKRGGLQIFEKTIDRSRLPQSLGQELVFVEPWCFDFQPAACNSARGCDSIRWQCRPTDAAKAKFKNMKIEKYWERLFFFCYSSTPKGLVHTNTLPMLFFSPKSSPAKQLDSNQQGHSDTPWETVGTEPVCLSTRLPPSISLISATSVPSHSPYHRGLTTHQPSWPVGWRFLNHAVGSQTHASANTSFLKHKFPERSWIRVCTLKPHDYASPKSTSLQEPSKKVTRNLHKRLCPVNSWLGAIEKCE